MAELKKHCDTCAYSYYRREQSARFAEFVKRQHCRNPVYNSPNYTQKMLLEDWDKGHCRLWTPIPEKGLSK